MKMDGTEDHHVKQNKPDSERQVSHVFSHMWNVKEMKVEGTLLGEEEGNREWDKRALWRGEHDQSMLYACIKMAH
jgi:hypothetical protein